MTDVKDTAMKPTRRFRSQDWFDNAERIEMTALSLERCMNYVLTPQELRRRLHGVGLEVPRRRAGPASA